jgi:hypothetical protein
MVKSRLLLTFIAVTAAILERLRLWYYGPLEMYTVTNVYREGNVLWIVGVNWQDDALEVPIDISERDANMRLGDRFEVTYTMQEEPEILWYPRY